MKARLAHPVTPVQHGMIFHHVAAPSSGVDVEQCLGQLGESIDADALRRAWQAVTARHPVFRSSFRWEGLSRPELLVHEHVLVCFESVDLTGLEEATRAERIEEFLVADRRRGFPLDQAPLSRVTLFRLADERFTMVWSYAHAILDNANVTVLEEVFAVYDAERAGTAPVLAPHGSYPDYLDWLASRLDENHAPAAAFWQAELQGLDTPTPLTRRAEPGPSGHTRRELRLTRETTDALRASSEARGTSLNACVLGAWALVVGQHARARDVVFGVTRSCRRSAPSALADAVGLFINTVPLRVRIEPSEGVAAWTARLRQHGRALSPFESTPLVEIQRASELSSGVSLFESIVVFNAEHNDATLQRRGMPPTRRFDWIDQTNFPVTLLAYGDPALLLRLSYQTEHLDEAMAVSVLSQLEAVLTDMAHRPDASLSDLALMGNADRAQVWALQRSGEVTVPANTIHGLVQQQAALTPEKTALVLGDVNVSYQRLNALANGVAKRLRERGAGPGHCVGIHVHRSLEMVVGLLGILKAGAAYVPLDPTFPRERLETMIADSGMRLLLAPRELWANLPPHDAEIVELLDVASAEASFDDPALPLHGSELAYVIFTSGSTGKPKGVMIEHRHVLSFFSGMDERLGTAPGVWLAVTSISFDISVLELFWTLARGFEVVLHGGQSARATGPTGRAPMELGLFYFGAEAAHAAGKYHLMLEGAKLADENGLVSIWTPERHFDPFGGPYPNPALTGAAIAAVTRRVAIRAGSVVAPLHHPLRLAEEWSVVDNISGGRVGLSFASGWHPNDFVLAPEDFERRRELMFERIEQVKKLWRGERLSFQNGFGTEVLVGTFPRPIQESPPIWITAGGSPQTFDQAGKMGANVLTNLLVQSEEELGDRIRLYRAARKQAGHAGPGNVTLMLHAFVGTDVERVRELVRAPLLAYLETATALIDRTRWELTSFATGYKGTRPADVKLPSLDQLGADERAAIMEHAFQRYFTSQGLFGTVESCVDIVRHFHELGVDEIACLIDFGLEADVVLPGVLRLGELRRAAASRSEPALDLDVASLIRRHQVTHFQCTPSLARLLCADEEQLASLGRLSAMLVGGEALAPDLANTLTARLSGRLLNMYGPTETTVWSTCAKIERGAAGITIGGPNVNTSVLILDADRRVVPPGVVGEITIGGQSVARGYVGRPELTGERFVTLPAQDGSEERYYCTGDLGRYRTDGSIEFLGRVDHQVKVGGHRIELGEIEAVLSTHDVAAEVVVVAREDVANEPTLAAYVVARQQGTSRAGRDDTWRRVWEQTYATSSAGAATDLDTTGWISGVTGEQIPEPQMREWVERTVETILRLTPKRVLEIGCGSGMLALRVAPHVESYTGVDFSGSVLAALRARVASRGMENVSLHEVAANQVAPLGLGPFDTIVLNSTIQYFPSVDYLLEVLSGLLPLLAPGGCMLLGDVRDLRQQPAICTETEMIRAGAEVSLGELRQRIRQRAEGERELVLDPRFFERLPGLHSEIVSVDVRLRGDGNRTEMSAYRYDAVLRVGPAATGSVAGGVPETLRVTTLDEIRRAATGRAAPVRFVDVPNARVHDAWRAVRHLETVAAKDELRVAELRETLRKDSALGVDPAALASLPGWEVEIRCAESGDADVFDVELVVPGTSPPRRARAQEGTADVESTLAELRALANTPRTGEAETNLVEELRELAQRFLPPYMVPASFSVLDAMPRTPNGKLDRSQLPKPGARTRAPAPYAAPVNDIEQAIAEVWREILHLDQVGTRDNFFDLGANSLMMVQAQGKLGARLGRKVSLVSMFQFTSVQALAEHLGFEAEESPTAQRSQDRVTRRQNAMAARREARAARKDAGE